MLTINMHFILQHFLPSIPPLCLLSTVIAFKANYRKLFATVLVVEIHCLTAEVSWRSDVLALIFCKLLPVFTCTNMLSHNLCQPSYINLQMWWWWQGGSANALLGVQQQTIFQGSQGMLH